MAGDFGPAQMLLRIGDTVLLSITEREKKGFFYHELSSSPFNFVTIFPGTKGINFPSISNASFEVVAEASQPESKRKSLRKPLSTEKCIRYGDHIQLQHVGSRKYLSLSTEISRTESNNLLVNLLNDGNTSKSTFIINPCYKIWLEGDPVHYGDQVKLESKHTQGEYLHCSNSTLSCYKIGAIEDHYELNMSAIDSQITFHLHSTPSVDTSSKTLHAGHCVRLFHREYECYVAAEGSFGTFTGQPEVVELDVHCRQRYVNQKGHATSSTSANTYWQIEKGSNPHGGDVLSWGERCRIKHLPTRLYLTVVNDSSDSFKVKLKEKGDSGNDLDTLFSLDPIIDEEGDVLLGSYARICHLLTQTWLHLDKEKDVCKRRGFDPKAKGLAGLKWDSAQLFTLSSTQAKGEYDAFILEEVSTDLMDLFNYVAGIVPVLQGHVEELNELIREKEKQVDSQKEKSKGSPCIPSKRINHVIKSLSELEEWIRHKPDAKKLRQKLLRNLKVIELIIEIVKKISGILPLKTTISHTTKWNEKLSPEEIDNLTKITHRCYDVLTEYLKGESRKNENYLARHIKFFLEEIGKGLHAGKVLVELVENNRIIVDEMAATTMGLMIERLQMTLNPRFLRFLGNLCICSGIPIQPTQEKILRDLVQKFGEELFIRTEVIDGTVCHLRKKSYERDGLQRWKKVQLLKEADEDYKFLDAQLYLFRCLCEGNNYISVKKIVSEGANTGYLTFEGALKCADDDNLNPKLRSRYIELILVMFVDCGDNRPYLDHLPYSFVYKNLVSKPHGVTGDDKITSQTRVKNDHFPALKTWILKTIEKKEVVFCDDDRKVDPNVDPNVVEKALEVLCHFIRFGYFDDSTEDIKNIVQHLIKLLDGQTEKQKKAESESSKQASKKQRHEDSPQNVIKLKLRALEALDLFMKFKLYVQLQKFMYHFKEMNKPVSKTQSTHDTQMMEKMLKTHPSSDENWARSESLIKNVRKRLCTICQDDSGFSVVNVESESPLTAAPETSTSSLCKVLLQLCQNENCEISKRSLKILTKIHFIDKDLFDKAVQVQLLTNVSVNDYNKAQQDLIQLHHYLSVDCTQEKLQTLIEILERLTAICYAHRSPLVPNPHNQLMLENLGVFSDILSHLLLRGTVPMLSVNPAQGKVFEGCFRLLRALATNNTRIQKFLFDRLDELLKVTVSPLCLAELLTEVFTGGAELCLQVEEESVTKIFEFIDCTKDSSIQSQFMEVLQAMAKIEKLELPVVQNQRIIVQQFCKRRETFCDTLNEILGDEDGKAVKRLETLKSSGGPKLNLLLSVTDLLATCAEGENAFIDSVCQTVFPVEEITRIIAEDLPLERKRPFVRFLIWVYMDAAEPADDSEVDQKIDEKKEAWRSGLTRSKSMWDFLKQVSVQLEGLHQALQEIPADKEQLAVVKYCFDSSSCLRTYSYTSAKPLLTIHTKRSIKIPNIAEDGVLLSGVLEYFLQAILPLIHAFFSRFFEPKTPQKEVSGDILKSLLKLGKESLLPRHFTHSNQLLLYQQVITTLANANERNIGQDEELQNCFRCCKDASADLKEPSSDFLQDYEEQKELNEKFNIFARNYQKVYVGPNTAAHQVHSKVKKLVYSDKGEELPLGPSFQRLVHYFSIASSTRRRQFKSRHVYAETSPLVSSLLRQLKASHTMKDDVNERERKVQDELDIRCLQILRALIHNQIKQIDPETKESDAKIFRKRCEDLVQPVQDCIQDSGNAIATVAPLLNHTNESISCEVLAFLKALLYAGNKKVQNGLLTLRETRDESLIITLKNKLTHAALNSTQRRKLVLLLSKREEATKRLKMEIEQHVHPSSFNTSVVINMDNSQSRTESIRMEILPKQPHDTMDSSTSKDTYTPDTVTILMLEVIGLMCDGQRSAVQNYLREQPETQGEIDVVEEVVLLLPTYIHDIYDPNIWKDITAVIQTLIEMCVGNVKNQHVILDNHVVDHLMTVLQHQHHSSLCKKHLPMDFEKCEDCQNLKQTIIAQGSALELLNIMLEETDADSETIIERIGGSLDVKIIPPIIDTFYQYKTEKQIILAQLDDNCERAMFNAYHILVTLREKKTRLPQGFETDEELLRNNSNGTLQKAIKECCAYSCSIEVNYKVDENVYKLTTVHFPFNPKHKLRDEVKEKVKWKVPRNSMEDKQRGLLECICPLKRDINHQINLKKLKKMKKYFFIGPLLSFTQLRHYLLILLTVLLNLIVLSVFVAPTSSDSETIVEIPDVQKWFGNFGLYILGTVHLLLALWMMVEYFVINYPHFGLPKFLRTLWNSLKKCINIVKNSPTKSVKKESVPNKTDSSCLDMNIVGLTTLYIIVFLTCSILSLIFYGYFYCICLFYVIVNNDVLQRVLRAVTKNGRALLWVAALGLIVLFIYAVITFAFMQSYVYVNNDAALFCASLFQCMWSVLRFGLIDRLGLLIPLQVEMDAMENPTFSNGFYIFRLIFDVSFFIIVTTIGIGVVFGIIIDAFAKLRDERYCILNDTKSKCFICDLPSHELDRRAGGFQKHVEEQHNMWNYVYYALYLDSIDTSDHTAIQKYIYDKLTSESTSLSQTKFFPHQEAIYLQMEADTRESRIAKLEKSLECILKRYQDKEQIKHLAAKREEQKKWEKEALTGKIAAQV